MGSVLRGHVEGTTGAELHISGFPRVQKKCGAVFPQIWGSIRSEKHFGELFSTSFPSSLHRCSHPSTASEVLSPLTHKSPTGAVITRNTWISIL